MPDIDGHTHDPLAFQALMYAGGELSPEETQAFEQRLASDQTVRDALVQAVQLAQPLHGRSALPDTAYRDRVRRRLTPTPKPWQLLFGRRSYRGHPLLWTALGGVAAALLVFLLLPRAQPEVVIVQAPPPSESAGGSLPVPDDDALDIARVWAEIPNGDHLMRAHAEEMRKKVRAEDRPRTVRGDERRERPLSNINPKH